MSSRSATMSVLTKSAPTSRARARKSTGGFNNPGWIEGGREERVEKIRGIGDGIRTRIREWLTETTSRELRAHGKNTGNRLSRKNPTSSAIRGTNPPGGPQHFFQRGNEAHSRAAKRPGWRHPLLRGTELPGLCRRQQRRRIGGHPQKIKGSGPCPAHRDRGLRRPGGTPFRGALLRRLIFTHALLYGSHGDRTSPTLPGDSANSPAGGNGRPQVPAQDRPPLPEGRSSGRGPVRNRRIHRSLLRPRRGETPFGGLRHPRHR